LQVVDPVDDRLELPQLALVPATEDLLKDSHGRGPGLPRSEVAAVELGPTRSQRQLPDLSAHDRRSAWAPAPDRPCDPSRVCGSMPRPPTCPVADCLAVRAGSW